MTLPLSPISKEDFLKANYIYFSNINLGFALYKSVNLTLKDIYPTEDGATYFSQFLIDEFNKSTLPVFVDFYIQNLNDDELKKLRMLLPSEYKSTLDSLLKLRESNTVFFEIKDSSIIPFLTYLSSKELFFTTFYFEEFTLWGNYNLTFPLFYKNDKAINSLLIPSALTY